MEAGENIQFIKVSQDGEPLMINVDHIIRVEKHEANSLVYVTNRDTPYMLDESYEDMTYLLPNNYSLSELEK